MNLNCSSCGAKLFVPLSAFGKKVKCNKCGTIVNVPNPIKRDGGNIPNATRQEQPHPPVINTDNLKVKAKGSSEIEHKKIIQKDDSIRPLQQENNSIDPRSPSKKEGLASPPAAIPDKNPLAAVSEWVKTQEKIVDIAQHAENPLIREKAVRKIDDQVVLGEIAQHDSNHWVREAAVKRLSDQKALIAVARSDPDHWVREEAVKKIDDRDVLSEIAKTDQNHWVCEIALRKLGSDCIE